MIALLLAAGRGRRLGAMGRDIPKCLIRLDGRTLLARHLAIFPQVGVDRVHVVLGYRADDVRAELERLAPAVPYDLTFNEQFQRGNVLSLRDGLAGLAARPDDDEPILVMDADVLYPAALLGRLTGSRHPTCVLLDRTATPSGEEMMVGVRDGRVGRIARDILRERWDEIGETVGFLKVAPADRPALRAAVDGVIADGRLDDEYESAYERFVVERRVGWETVDDLPWTEIDFPEDVARAEREVLPRVRAADGGPVDA